MLKKIYNKIFKDLSQVLEKEIDNCESLLDIGCGKKSIVKNFKNIYKVGVDANKEAIEISKKKGIHNKYILKDVTKLNLKEKSFDCVLALDLIEHLEKEKSLKLIKKIEKIAKKKLIILVPNGYIKQKHVQTEWDIHKSEWNYKEMKKLGFKVYGWNGLKFLRKEHAEVKIKPKIFGSLLCDISQKIVYKHPKYAFHLLCIKTCENESRN
jgi:ubiquinone/menaquinone biosynthesis C-methylase UbiE